MFTTVQAETRVITDADELRQGDIFEWLEAHRQTPWRRWGIVVTADCDIVKRKHGDVLSYIPLLTAADYARLFVLPPVLEKALSNRHQQMMKSVHALQASYRPEFPEPLSATAIKTILMEDGPDALLNTLGVPEGKERARAQEVLVDVFEAVRAQRDGSMTSLFEAIVRLRGGKPDHRTGLRRQIEDKFACLPGDAFFVGLIDGVDDAGYVAYLRLVRELPITAIAVKSPDLLRDEVTTRRVARMAAPFVYKLTQQLGDVFSSIGLPQSYDDARKECISAMWSTASVSMDGAV